MIQAFLKHPITQQATTYQISIPSDLLKFYNFFHLNGESGRASNYGLAWAAKQLMQDVRNMLWDGKDAADAVCTAITAVDLLLMTIEHPNSVWVIRETGSKNEENEQPDKLAGGQEQP